MTVLFVDTQTGVDRVWTGNISGATRANPCVITITGHKFKVGDALRITGVVGMTQLNNNIYNVTAVATNLVTIDVNSSGFTAYTSGGVASAEYRTLTGITNANPAVVTCGDHGFINGQWVSFNNIIGMTEINEKVYQVQNVTTDTFELAGVNSTSYGTFTSGRLAPAYATFEYVRLLNYTVANDEVRIRETTAPTTHSLGNVTFTKNSATINTSVSYVGVISVNDFIGKPSAAGNGADETYYKVTAINATTITLMGYYAGETETVSGIKKLAPKSEGLLNGMIVYNFKNYIVSGGWVFATNARTSETWYKHAQVFTTAAHRGLYNLSAQMSHLNFVDVYENLVFEGVTSNCSFSGYVYSLNTSGVATLNNIRVMHNMGPSWNAVRLASACTINTMIVSSYASVSSIGIGLATAVPQTFTDVRATCCGYGVSTIDNVKVEGLTIDNCNWGFQVNSSNYGVLIKDCDISLCTRGINFVGTQGGNYVLSCNIDQCTTGIYFIQNQGSRVELCLFTNNNYDIDCDVYCANIYSVNNSHITPGTRAYNRAGQCGPIYIINCTIDAGSTSKTFLQTINNNFITPQFYLQESFGLTGAYYAKYEVVKNTSTVPPSVQTKFAVTTTYNYTDYKVASTYAKSGVGATLNFKMRALSAGWVGTIIPKVKLNGAVIYTGSTITSINHLADDNYSYVIPPASIVQDGELSIEFNTNCNTISVLIKDFEVV